MLCRGWDCNSVPRKIPTGSERIDWGLGTTGRDFVLRAGEVSGKLPFSDGNCGLSDVPRKL